MDNKRKLIAAVAGLVTTGTAFAGGTFAWFQFTNTVNLGTNGSVVDVGDRLKVGFYANLSSQSSDDLSKYGLEKDNQLANVYWVSNNIAEETLEYVLSTTGYATNELIPVTSNANDGTQEINLIKGPAESFYYTGSAKKTSYIKLDLVFLSSGVRTVDGEKKEVVTANQNIYFNEVNFTGEIINGVDTSNAIRLGINSAKEENSGDFSKGNGTINNKIFKPKATSSGQNRVSGVMDLNGDGAWDYANGKEIFYNLAQASGTPTYGAPDTSGFLGVSQSKTSFLEGKTRNGIQPVTNQDQINAYARYDATNICSYGEDNATPIASTNENGLAYVSLYVYVEGWDPACTNDSGGTTFDMDVSFVAPEAT